MRDVFGLERSIPRSDWNDQGKFKLYYTQIAKVSSDRNRLTGKTTAFAELVFDLDVGFSTDDFLSWINRIRERSLSDFLNDQEMSALPRKLSFDTAQGAPIPFGATSCLRAVVDLSSVEKARFIRSGLRLRDCVDIFGAECKRMIGSLRAKQNRTQRGYWGRSLSPRRWFTA